MTRNRRFWVDARAWLDDDFIGDCDLHGWGYGTRPTWLAVIPVRMIGLLSYGDYDNSCSVERSNNRVFWDTPEYASVPGVRRYSGSYGGVGILVASWAMAWVEPGTSPVWNGQSWTPGIPVLVEMLDQLEDYPVLDDDDLSQFELDADSEAWDDWARRDYVRELVKHLDLDQLEDVYDDTNEKHREIIFEVFSTVAERIGEYWRDDGPGRYIDVERIARATEPGELVEFFGGYVWKETGEVEL